MLRSLSFAALPLAFMALAALDCGGRLDTSLLPACPGDGTCSSDCKEVITDCSGTHDLACTCDATGHTLCPDLGAPSCQSDCDALMQRHEYLCSNEGERCPSPFQPACLDMPELYCTCSGGQFVCDAPPPSCPSPVCPPPSQVKYGAPCTGYSMLCPTDQTVTDCDGNVVGAVECSCMGGTFGDCMAPPTPPCAMDAGGSDAIWIDAGSKSD